MASEYRAKCGLHPKTDLCLSGLIGSAFSLLQFFSAPLTGAASDYLGRRPVMMLSLVSLWTQLLTGRERMQLWGSQPTVGSHPF